MESHSTFQLPSQQLHRHTHRDHSWEHEFVWQLGLCFICHRGKQEANKSKPNVTVPVRHGRANKPQPNVMFLVHECWVSTPNSTMKYTLWKLDGFTRAPSILAHYISASTLDVNPWALAKDPPQLYGSC